jgi:protein-tyrosine phosphatase
VSNDTYRILMVCTGNICRSPVMERLFVARLRERLMATDAARFEVSSGGTWGMAGARMSPNAAETLVALGGDPAGFDSCSLSADMLATPDLILTAASGHRELVVTADPQAADHPVTLREFARLLEPVTAAEIDGLVSSADPVERMRAVVAAALDRREAGSVGTAGADDIGDPYGRERAVYVRVAHQIDAAIATVMELLAPA